MNVLCYLALIISILFPLADLSVSIAILENQCNQRKFNSLMEFYSFQCAGTYKIFINFSYLHFCHPAKTVWCQNLSQWLDFWFRKAFNSFLASVKEMCQGTGCVYMLSSWKLYLDWPSYTVSISSNALTYFLLSLQNETCLCQNKQIEVWLKFFCE